MISRGPLTALLEAGTAGMKVMKSKLANSVSAGIIVAGLGIAGGVATLVAVTMSAHSEFVVLTNEQTAAVQSALKTALADAKTDAAKAAALDAAMKSAIAAYGDDAASSITTAVLTGAASAGMSADSVGAAMAKLAGSLQTSGSTSAANGIASAFAVLPNGLRAGFVEATANAGQDSLARQAGGSSQQGLRIVDTLNGGGGVPLPQSDPVISAFATALQNKLDTALAAAKSDDEKQAAIAEAIASGVQTFGPYAAGSVTTMVTDTASQAGVSGRIIGGALARVVGGAGEVEGARFVVEAIAGSDNTALKDSFGASETALGHPDIAELAGASPDAQNPTGGTGKQTVAGADVNGGSNGAAMTPTILDPTRGPDDLTSAQTSAVQDALKTALAAAKTDSERDFAIDSALSNALSIYGPNKAGSIVSAIVVAASQAGVSAAEIGRVLAQVAANTPYSGVGTAIAAAIAKIGDAAMIASFSATVTAINPIYSSLADVAGTPVGDNPTGGTFAINTQSGLGSGFTSSGGANNGTGGGGAGGTVCVNPSCTHL